MSLRGHGTSPTDKPLHKVSIDDYLDDVRSVADDLSGGGHPVLIGHSLGGYMIQRYLEDRAAPAAVLVGSLPPSGVLGTALRVWRRRPQMTVKSFNDPTLVKFLSSAKLAREYLFCADTPETIVAVLLGPRRAREHPRGNDRSDVPPGQNPAGDHPDAGPRRGARRLRQRRRGACHGARVCEPSRNSSRWDTT